MTNEERINIERLILTRFVTDAIKAGHLITVDDGEGESKPFASVEATVAACMSTDEDRLYVYHQVKGKYEVLGMAHFQYGNDGYDVLSDHSVCSGFDELCKGANDLSNELTAKWAG